MNFKDAQLQKCYDSNLIAVGDSSEDLRGVRALITTHDLLQLLEGPHSARVHETIEHLLSMRMRPALRHWYQRPDADTDSAAIELRNQLSQLAGENLERPIEISNNPP